MAILEEATKSTLHYSPHNGMSTLVTTWYNRLSDSALNQSVELAIKDAVRKHVFEDEQFRSQIQKAITEVAAAMPLDEIAAVVKKAIIDMRANDGKL